MGTVSYKAIQEILLLNMNAIFLHANSCIFQCLKCFKDDSERSKKAIARKKMKKAHS